MTARNGIVLAVLDYTGFGIPTVNSTLYSFAIDSAVSQCMRLMFADSLLSVQGTPKLVNSLPLPTPGPTLLQTCEQPPKRCLLTMHSAMQTKAALRCMSSRRARRPTRRCCSMSPSPPLASSSRAAGTLLCAG